MSFLSTGARAAARPLRRSLPRQPRRYAGHEAGHGHGHGGAKESALHVESGAGSEHLSRGFYFSIAFIPFAYVLYSLASSPGDNFVSRQIKKYEDNKKADETKNVIHTTMMEQAAAERQLFSGVSRDESGPTLRLPELFNAGSPYNVSAGQGSADLSELAKFYKQESEVAEQERVARLKRNNGVSVYD
ncbi:hypothetical protein EDD37DRAFT_273305 [Exophiala viscosa]|uniref:Uncharacterized protein n=1 Tax=Exophiala viscosa TaxID=2486360 RepID=A0AAN6IID6_9EURO|nr:hypothetical protein EDD36DRAFT_426725 [Exophiala viscosa]KAI1627710.1 hypothetical protein EDD37DRAFT_273305 [Exophiala viscosa]